MQSQKTERPFCRAEKQVLQMLLSESEVDLKNTKKSLKSLINAQKGTHPRWCAPLILRLSDV